MIEKYFNEGLSNKEIAQILGINYCEVAKELKRLGLVRSPEQLREIRRRCAKKGRKVYAKKYPKEPKNYLTDSWDFGISESSGNIEKDRKVAIKSIQKLRKK